MGTNPAVTLKRAADTYLKFMQLVGLPINDETDQTPMRIARMFMSEWSSHLLKPPQVTRFKGRNYDQYIVERDIQFASLCEHHHFPFYGVIHFGYLPKDWLAGLSKIPRVVRHFASRPQLQENLVMQIADYLFEQLDPHCLMVVSQASHTCMQCRGIRDPRSQTVTSKILETEGFEVDKMEMLTLMGLRV